VHTLKFAQDNQTISQIVFRFLDLLGYLKVWELTLGIYSINRHIGSRRRCLPRIVTYFIFSLG
jgi:hypothetical protein